jgi:hypothetical protein
MFLRLEKWTTMCSQNTKSDTTKKVSQATPRARAGKRVSAKYSAMATLCDWKRQPARVWELTEAEQTGQTVLELRERFLRLINAELRGPDNDYVN